MPARSVSSQFRLRFCICSIRVRCCYFARCVTLDCKHSVALRWACLSAGAESGFAGLVALLVLVGLFRK